MSNLTDRQRVELALPARVLLMAVNAALEGDDPVWVGVRDDLVLACNEPVADLLPAQRQKVARRIERTAREIAGGFEGKASAAKAAMSTYYFVDGIIESGALELLEGSPMANATTKVLAALDSSFAIKELDRSAARQGSKMLAACRAAGLYV